MQQDPLNARVVLLEAILISLGPAFVPVVLPEPIKGNQDRIIVNHAWRELFRRLPAPHIVNHVLQENTKVRKVRQAV